MPNGISSNVNQEVPTFIPLADAAKKYGISEEALTQLIEAGKIEAVQLSSGELLVAAENNGQESKTKEEIIIKEYGQLKDQWITVSAAAHKYDVPGTTIRGWLTLDYVQCRDNNYPMKLNEAEVAYCAEIYHVRKKTGIRTGAPLLDERGLAYKLKHPQLSKYRRQRREEYQPA